MTGALGPSRAQVLLTAVVVGVAIVIGGCAAGGSAAKARSAGITAATRPVPFDCAGGANRLPLTLMSAPAASTRLAGSVALSAGFRSAGDQISASQAVFDFPVPGTLVEPDQTMVLVAVTAHATAPGWLPDRSLALEEFRRQADGITLSRLVCPLDTPDIAAAIRASGRVPLVGRLAPGQTVTGWVAFAVYRDSSALALRMQRLTPDGGAAADYPLLQR